MQFDRSGRRCSTASIVGFVLLAAICSACGEDQDGLAAEPTPVGYWEGKGTAMERPMNDAVRKLTRSADYEFWFTVSEDGEVEGEIEIRYDATLRIENLPNVTVPVPGGSISFEPEVGGTMTDLDRTRKFPLVGTLVGDQESKTLTLAIATPEADRGSLEFTIRADAGVSGGMSVGGASVGGLPMGQAQVFVQTIDMMPFDPFGAPVEVEYRAGGVFAASYEDRGENHAVEWSARLVPGQFRDPR